MKRRRLWLIALISGLSVLLLSASKPVGQSVTFPLRWEHVNQTCRSRVCDDAINREQLRAIESYMNPNADPCDSFHSYACGNWPHRHPHSTTMMKIANVRLMKRYEDIFESWLQGRHEAATMRSIQTLKARRACAAQNCVPEIKALIEIEEAPMENFVTTGDCKENCGGGTSSQTADIVKQKLLHYYETCKSNGDNVTLQKYFDLIKPRLNLEFNNFNWLDAAAELGRFGYSRHFLNINVVQLNKSAHRLVIFPHDVEHHVELNADLYEILSVYTKHNRSVLQQQFNDLEAAFLKSSCKYCLNTPLELDSDVNGNEFEIFELDCDCYTKKTMNFSSLNAQLPAVDWQRYLRPQLGRDIDAGETIEVVNLELIKVQLNAIEQLDIELQLLYTIASFLGYLLAQQENLRKHNSTAHNCLHHMRKLFALPMAYVYDKAVYGSKRAESEKVIEEIFQELKTQFTLTIQRNKMQFVPSVLAQLQAKLDNLSINIGNLPKNVTVKFYNDLMDAYNFINDFHYNHLHALEVFFKLFNSLLSVPDAELEEVWHSFNLHQPFFPDTLDATPYYFVRSNLVVLTFNYLQTPFYDESFWPALLYGDLANTLGHEMMHAFDTEFLKYDANGNPNTQPLANMFLNANFGRNLACLKQGTVFVRERIADVSGSRLALNAYLRLDPQAMTHNGRLYFLQFAQFFCGSADPLTFQLQDPNHDIDKLRLDYVLGIVPEFAQVFNCPIGSPMNPISKCEMYR